jgi:hypothetical protein
MVVGVEKAEGGGWAGHPSQILRAAGAQNLIKTLRAGSSAASTRRVVVAKSWISSRRDHPPCRSSVLLPPGYVATRRSSPPLSALL